MPNELAITLFLVGIVVAIMIHEWGHFATARWFGMRADRFFLGFGPTIWSTRKGETEYGVKALPVGGFVRIKGMSPEDERLRPLPDAVFASSEDGVVLDDAALRRLDRELDVRGASDELRERIVRRARTNIPADARLADARLRLTEIVVSEVPDTGRVGDLHHRLLKGDEERFFHDRPAWQRAIVLVSGSAMHFVQAVALLLIGYLFFGSVVPLAVVDTVEDGTPAAEVGLQPGDEFVAVEGMSVADFEELRDLLRESPGEQLSLTIERDGETVQLEAVPEAAEDPDTGETVGVLGFRPETGYEPLPAIDALYETFVGPGSVPALTVQTVEALGRVFGPDGLGTIFSAVAGDAERDEQGAISMVGAAQAAGSGTAAFGPLFLFVLLASVNVFVGIFNMIPLPPLDGGHLAVLGIERVVNAARRARGRAADFSIDPRAVAAVAIPVIVFIATVSVALVWLDVVNPVQVGQ